MFFCWDITITANTAEKSPKKKWLSLPKGIVTHVNIKFPAGCHGMVKVRVFKEALQLIPLSEKEWVTGDDEPVATDTYAELLEAPYKLKLLACSPDTTYDHTISVRVEVEPEHAAGVSALTRMFKGFLEKLGIDLDEQDATVLEAESS